VAHSHPPVFRERLTAPWWLWFAVFAVSLSLGIAYAAPFTLEIGVTAFALAFGVAAFGLIRSAPLIEVREGVLHAGIATLPLACVGEVTALDAEQARMLRGPGADPFAWLVLRGWIATAVRIDVDDPEDDTPYWYVSTRRPRDLMTALAPSGADESDRLAGGNDQNASG
jgi:Protein of unknown function (DUF3093)